MIDYIRETNYGKVFDVRTLANPNNRAYFDLGLGVHTDSSYREPVPGLQTRHCLQASKKGGESTLSMASQSQIVCANNGRKRSIP